MAQRTEQTGIWGLDEVLPGGIPAGHLYLIEGEPGTGKTTLALQFLLAGVAAGQNAVYVTLSETAEEMRVVADSHGWDLTGVDLVELAQDDARDAAENQYTVFESTEVELGDTMKAIYAAAQKSRPSRIAIDSLSELRLLSRDGLRFRRELLGLKRFFAEMNVTVLMLDDLTLDVHGGLLQSIAHGVVRLERVPIEYGGERRRMIIPKLRGAKFREGYHDYRVEKGGLQVFPRLVASEHHSTTAQGLLCSGHKELDALLGGGLDKGTSTIIVGPSGAGKSTLSASYAAAATKAGERVELFLLDENLGTFMARDSGLNLGIAEAIKSGLASVRQIDPAEVSPGELTQLIRDSVEKHGTRHIVIDSLNGLVQAMPGEKTLIVQVHELLAYLAQSNVTTVLTLAQHGFMGPSMTSAADLSYLADTLILLRFFEAYGELRHAISVIKKRTGFHEKALRELRIVQGGFEVGEPLREFQGILTGVPRYVGKEGELFDADRR